eukprot:TRINITY_DN3275_c0_g2_i1.p1 TRINITY_DN3275_c0_g2~~TRINITY_DN3275_c0_g2_i1.p1  ORF type:complete len:427 (+),score=130.09 TRINITY_DN3275_c0_g2_i1:169-1449(+)
MNPRCVFFSLVAVAVLSSVWMLYGNVLTVHDGRFVVEINYGAALGLGSPGNGTHGGAADTVGAATSPLPLLLTDATKAGAAVQRTPRDPVTPPPAQQQQQQQYQAWDQRLQLHGHVVHPRCPDPKASGEYPENGVKMCPIPGLNNLLFTQTNRYYCAFRDKVKRLNLRNRVCMKYSRDWFRYSDILAVNYSNPKAVPVCFGPDYPDPEKTFNIKHCEWRHVVEWYGSPRFWEARSHISFNAGYTDYINAWLAAHAPRGSEGQVLPYLSLHVRRGDYITHCIKMRRKREPPWLSYSWKKRRNEIASNDPYGASCLPSTEQIVAGINRVVELNPHVGAVFLSSNDEALLGEIQGSGKVRLPLFRLHFNGVANATAELGLRGVDLAVIDMLLLSRGSAFIFNRFSSFSATPYEIAYVTGRVTETNIWWW